MTKTELVNSIADAAKLTKKAAEKPAAKTAEKGFVRRAGPITENTPLQGWP